MIEMRGVGVILLGSVLFGVMAVWVRVASEEMASTQIAFLRFAGSCAVLLAFARRGRLRPRPGNLGRVLLRGLLGATAVTLYYHGIAGAGAALATLLTNTYPVFTALFATVLMGERFNGRLAAALVLSLIGVVIVLAPGGHGGALGAGVSADRLPGAVSALVAAVLSGGALATVRHLRHSEDALLITTYFMAVGAAVTASPALLSHMPAITPGLALILTGIVLSSVGGQLLLHYGLGFATATQGSLAAATSVLTASVFEALLLGERLGRRSVFGACLLVGAVVLAARRGTGRAVVDSPFAA